MKQEKDIKDLLQKHFASFEAEPDRDLWSGIAAGLQSESPKRRVIPLWTRYAAAVAASLLLLFGLIWMLRDPGQAPQGPVAKEIPPVVPAPLEQSSQPEAELASEGTEEGVDQAQQDLPQTPQRPAPVQRVAQQQPGAGQAVEKTPRTVPEPQRDRRMARPGLETMTPLHQQVAIRQEMRDRLAEQPAMVSPRSERPTRKRPEPATEQAPSNPVATTAGKRNALDLNQLTLANAVNFASNELSKWASSPVEIYTEETPEREVRTYEFDLLNLRITRKVHHKN